MFLKILRFISEKLIGRLPKDKRDDAYNKFLRFLEAVSPDTLEVHND